MGGGGGGEGEAEVQGRGRPLRALGVWCPPQSPTPLWGRSALGAVHRHLCLGLSWLALNPGPPCGGWTKLEPRVGG